MRRGTITSNNRECTIYEAFSEVQDIAFSPPKFCEKDAAELLYYSFFDSLNRFTLMAYCPKCKRKWAISTKEEKYEAHMLERWAKMVKERAGNKCEMASPECSGELHAHHIIPKHLDPTRKYNVENGLCLCEAHHKKIHHYM